MPKPEAAWARGLGGSPHFRVKLFTYFGGASCFSGCDKGRAGPPLPLRPLRACPLLGRARLGSPRWRWVSTQAGSLLKQRSSRDVTTSPLHRAQPGEEAAGLGPKASLMEPSSCLCTPEGATLLEEPVSHHARKGGQANGVAPSNPAQGLPPADRSGTQQLPKLQGGHQPRARNAFYVPGFKRRTQGDPQEGGPGEAKTRTQHERKTESCTWR